MHTYFMLGAVLSTLHVLTHLILTSLGRQVEYYCSLHISDEETEAQRLA